MKGFFRCIHIEVCREGIVKPHFYIYTSVGLTSRVETLFKLDKDGGIFYLQVGPLYFIGVHY